jgi:hypothetical protein
MLRPVVSSQNTPNDPSPIRTIVEYAAPSSPTRHATGHDRPPSVDSHTVRFARLDPDAHPDASSQPARGDASSGSTRIKSPLHDGSGKSGHSPPVHGPAIDGAV